MNLLAMAFATLAMCGNAQGEPTVWQPAAGHTQEAIWPGAVPDRQSVPGPENATVSTELLAGKESARPDFAMSIYPGHLATSSGTLNANIAVSSQTPPTFLVQSEDDHVNGVKQAPVYYTALANAHVPAEMHLYAHGGHAFGGHDPDDTMALSAIVTTESHAATN